MQKRILPTTSSQHGRGRKLAGTAERKLAQSQTTLPQKFMTKSSPSMLNNRNIYKSMLENPVNQHFFSGQLYVCLQEVFDTCTSEYGKRIPKVYNQWFVTYDHGTNNRLGHSEPKF
jgi:hypothetical protein